MSNTLEVHDIVNPEEGRGRDANPNTGKSKRSKDKSIDVVGALETRLQRVEVVTGETRDRMDAMELNEEELEGRFGELKEEFNGRLEGLDQTMRNTSMHLQGEFDALKAQILQTLAAFETQMQEMRADWALCKLAVAGGAITPKERHKVEVPKPMSYDGRRDAREVDNFLWHMERYFEAISLEETEKVQTAVLYLKDTATLWWRRRHADMERGTCTINTWDSFKKELKKQFYPENATFLARRNLKRLKQTGSIRDYVKEFSTLMLDVPSMTEEELLFNFMDELQGWAA